MKKRTELVGYRWHNEDDCECMDCGCPCHVNAQGAGGLDGDQAYHRESKCNCKKCNCKCHGEEP